MKLHQCFEHSISHQFSILYQSRLLIDESITRSFYELAITIATVLNLHQLP